jgi:hypothetical protein
LIQCAARPDLPAYCHKRAQGRTVCAGFDPSGVSLLPDRIANRSSVGGPMADGTWGRERSSGHAVSTLREASMGLRPKAIGWGAVGDKQHALACWLGLPAAFCCRMEQPPAVGHAV